jgi:hypothetical protein
VKEENTNFVADIWLNAQLVANQFASNLPEANPSQFKDDVITIIIDPGEGGCLIHLNGGATAFAARNRGHLVVSEFHPGPWVDHLSRLSDEIRSRSQNEFNNSKVKTPSKYAPIEDPRKSVDADAKQQKEEPK